MSGKMLGAAQIVAKPEIVDDIEGEYQIIFDSTISGGQMNNLNKAINIMEKKDWICVNISIGGSYAHVMGYALMKKVH